MKRIAICSVATAATLGLAGCNAVDMAGSPSTTSTSTSTGSPTPSTTATPVPSTPTTAGSAQSPSRSTVTVTVIVPRGSSAGGASSHPASTPTSPALAPATKVKYVWPDESWSISNADGDVCVEGPYGGSEPFKSMFATAAGRFGCGGGAWGWPVCKRSGAVVTCIAAYADRSAVRFTTSAAVTNFPADPNPVPISVTLANGETCVPVGHDMPQHYQDRRSWLYCGNDTASGAPVKAILTLDGEQGHSYFHKTSPMWTVDYDVGTNPPVSMNVTEVVYAS